MTQKLKRQLKNIFSAGKRKMSAVFGLVKKIFVFVKGIKGRKILEKIKKIKIKNIFKSLASRRAGAMAVLFIFIVANIFQNTPHSEGATYTFVQTDWSGSMTANNAAHPGDKTGWNEFTSSSNISSVVPGQVTISETEIQNFSETFTADTYNDTDATTANWNTSSGQVEMPSESIGTNISAKLNGILGGSTIRTQVKDGTDYYYGSSTGKFVKYDSITDTASDLTSKISSFWSTSTIYSLAFDSANDAIYLAGASGKFARYNTAGYSGEGTYPDADTAYNLGTKISSFWSGNTVYSLVFDSASNVLYAAGGGGKFARYNTTAYTAEGTYPTADTAYDLSAKISSFLGGGIINKLMLDSSNAVVYLAGNNLFAKYDIVSDAASDLRGKLVAITGTDTSISVSLYADGKIYGGTGYGNFFSYDVASGISTDLTSKISSFWSTNAVYSLAFDSANKVVYIAGDGGKFTRYNTPDYTGEGTYPDADTVYDLSAKISALWTVTLYSLTFDSANNVIYLGGLSGKFARYNTTSYTAEGTYPTADTAYDLTAKISSFWSTNAIQSLAFDSVDSVVYLGSNLGKFARYNTVSYAAEGTYPTADTGYDLTAKISSFWSTNVVYSLVFDSANKVIYIGGGGGKFARYNTASYAAGGTYPTADTAYNIASKISSFWGSNTLYSLAFDSASNVVYIGSASGKLARYNTTAYTAGGIYASADTGYDLTSKISSFWDTNGVNSITLDGGDNAVYLGGTAGRFGKYSSGTDTGSDLFSSLNSANLFGITFNLVDAAIDVSNSVVYLGTSSPSYLFMRYNTAPYASGGTYPTADTAYNIVDKISSFWGGSALYSIDFDSVSNAVYLGGYSGKFARYNTTSYTAEGTYPTADTAYDLTVKISSFWSANGIYSILIDSASGILYLGGDGGKFARYNATSYGGGGTYPTADTGYDLTAKANGISWNAASIFAITGASNNELYLGGDGGKFAKYNVQTGTVTDLTTKISSFWSTSIVYSLAFDSANNVVYLAGASGKLARYNTTAYTAEGTYPTADTGYNLTSKISSFWSASIIYSITFDSANNVVYLGGASGKLARYNTTSYSTDGVYPNADTGYNLTSKISSFWGANAINSLSFDSVNNSIYLGGASGKFARYNTTAYTAEGTYPTADTGYNLTTKLSSFWSTNAVNAITLDSANNSIYLGGAAGKFARYSFQADSAVNLRSPETLSFWGTSAIYALAIEGGGNLYVGGLSGYFAEKASLPAVAYGQSLTFDGVAYNIYFVTLTASDTPGTGSTVYYLSNNGGTDWVEVTPGVTHTFSTIGSDLRFKIGVSGNATVQNVAVDYWSYFPDTCGELISSKYNSGDAVNTLAKIEWTEDAPSGTHTKFQIRTSADGSAWTAWCGPDDGVPGSCSSETYFIEPNGTEMLDDINTDQTNDQWFQYKLFLGSDGLSTPTISDVTVTYVVNAPPQIQNISASQGADGLVTVDYQVLDPDTTEGGTPNAVEITLEYCTADCSDAGNETWTDAVTATGDGAGISVQEATWTAHQIVWTPSSDYSGQYNMDDFKVRVKAYDGEMANHTAYGQSSQFNLDTSDPTLQANTLLVNDSSSAVTPESPALTLKLQNIVGDTATETVYAQFSKNEVDWYGANADNTLAASGNWGTGFALNNLASLSWPWTMTTRAETITVRIKDGYGNLQSTTDANSSQYNAYPELQTISASQGADGLVTVNYEVKDSDTATGVNPNEINITLQYCTADCSNPGSETWTDATTATGDGAGVSVAGGTWTAHQIVWTAKTDYANQYNATDFKVRVKANDGSPVNNLDYLESSNFVLDTANPVAGSFAINHSANQLAISAPTDSSDFEIYVSSSIPTLFNVGNKTSPLLNQSSSYPNAYTYSSMTSDPATVYVGVKDAKGNTAYAQATTPAKPNNPIYFDISDTVQGAYQEFIAWDVVSPSQSGSGFAAYKIYRKIDDGAFTFLAESADYNFNYYLDKIKDSNSETPDSDENFDPNNPSTYYYKVLTVDTNGNTSLYSSTIQDSLDGTGGSDSTPPTITNVQVSSINTTSAVITWDTDELSNSSVGYSTDYTYVPERGLSSYQLAHEITLTGLLPDTTYHINVQSEDVYNNTGLACFGGEGCSPGSNDPDVFTFTTNPGPSISGVSVLSNNTQATISWVTTTNSDTYVVYSDEVSGGALVSPEEIGTPTLVGGSPLFNHSQMVTTYNDVPLIPGETYYFYVKSTDATTQTGTDNNGGNFYSFTTTQDDDDPIISSVSAVIINSTKAAINWTTDEAATSVVNYGTVSGVYTASSEVLTLNKSHYVIISPLLPNTNYYYTVTSTDINANTITSAEYSFTTLMNPEQQHSPLVAMTATIEEVEYDLTNSESVAVFEPAVLTDTSAVIEFETDQTAMCVIEYRVDGQAYNPTDFSIEETGYNTNHSMHIMSLILDTKYYYQIECVDNLPEGQAGLVNSTEFNFTTKLQQVDQHGPLTSITGIADPLPVITNNKAVVTFNTDQVALCSVDFGTVSGDYSGTAVSETDYNGNHAIYLSGLTADTQYFHQISCADDLTNSVQSSEKTFTTLKDPEFQHDTLTEITSITTPVITDTKTVVAFNTDQAALCSVDFGTVSGDYSAVAVAETDYNGNHAIYLSGLTEEIPYFYQITCEDNLETIISSAEYNFTTLTTQVDQHDPLSTITEVSDPPTVLTDTKAVISFTTDQAAECVIEFGTTSGNYNEVPVTESGFNETHSMHIPGLIFETEYFYQITCSDNLGTTVSSAEFDFITNPQQVDHAVLTDPGDPLEVLVSDSEAVVQLPTLNTEATSKLCYDTQEITDVETCLNFVEITDPSRIHSYYLYDLNPSQTYYVKIKITDSTDGSNLFLSSDGLYFETRNTLLEHTNLTDPGNPTVLQKSDTEAVIVLPIANTSSTSKLCYSVSTGFDVETCHADNLKTINTATRLHHYQLTGLTAGVTYYFKTKISDVVSPNAINFTSEEVSFITTGGAGSGVDSIVPTISGVSVQVNSGESATVSWDTNEVASSYIQYSITSGTYTDMAGDPLVNYDNNITDTKINYSTVHSVIINGLTPNVQYYFQAISHDKGGNIGISSESNFTTEAASSISSFNITSVALGEALVTWSTSEKTSSTVEYGLTTVYGQKKEDTAKTTDHSITINGLASATPYHFRVSGKDENNNLQASEDRIFTPKSPPQIGTVSVKDITEHEATVAFTTDFPTDYTITYTSAGGDSGSKGKPDFAINHEITLDKLKPGTTYALKIKASDEQGNSVEKVAENFTTGKDEKAPEITKARTESALAQSDKVQTIISWETNELSVCSLIYREGAAGEEREYKVSDRATSNHVAVVTTFKPGTVYYFKIKSLDEAGNASVSSEYALLTPQKKENIVQIIVNNFQDIFSWVDKV